MELMANISFDETKAFRNVLTLASSFLLDFQIRSPELAFASVEMWRLEDQQELQGHLTTETRKVPEPP